MSKGLVIMLGAMAVFLAAFFAIEIHVRKVYRHHSYYVDALLEARSGAVSCLILGDSHAAAGFRGELNHCANLAAGGMNLLQIYDVYQSAQRNNQIDLLVVTLGPQQFSAIRQANRSRAFSHVAQEWLQGWNPMIIQPLIFDRWLNWIPGYYLHQPDLSSNSVWQRKNEQSRALAVQKRLAVQKMQMKLPAIDSHTGIYLQKLLLSALENGSKICIVRPAVTTEYENAAKTELLSEDWLAVLQFIRHLTIPVIDYQELGFSFTEADFSNEDHLNSTGAAKFAPAAVELCMAKLSEPSKSLPARF